jgi:phenylacetic acid degradation protein paaN
MQNPAEELFIRHQDILNNAIKAIHAREFYAQYPEAPSGKIYGEDANEKQQTLFQNQLGKEFCGLLQESDAVITSSEVSPYTLEKLNIEYPVSKQPETYVTRAGKALSQWKQTSAAVRAGLLIESLERIRNRFYEIAYATMHTTGQSFMMSFQASGPHSNDRALEAIALGYQELTRFPGEVTWDKPMGKFNVVLKKFYKTIPKGVSLSIGCSTFPVWNTVPGLYASLMTGNPVIVKPHPGSVYPIAIVVAEIQQLLKEHGLDVHIVQLATDTLEKPITKILCEHPEVKLIDFTGGNAFGDYVESLPGKVSFTEKAGVNSVILDSFSDLKGAMQNLAFSVSLYSGQMCTCPQNIYIPKSGVTVNGETLSYEHIISELCAAIDALTGHEKAGPGTLGAIQNPTTASRIQQAVDTGAKVHLASRAISNPEFPNARIATPVVLEVSKNNKNIYEREWFGPIVMVIPTDSTEESISLAKELSLSHGAITCAAYCTNPEIEEKIATEMADAYTTVSFNLTGPIWVNQSAGFSDFHVTGGNPAGNASFTNPEFVLKRFVLVGMRSC